MYSPLILLTKEDKFTDINATSNEIRFESGGKEATDRSGICNTHACLLHIDFPGGQWVVVAAETKFLCSSEKNGTGVSKLVHFESMIDN